MSAIKQLSEDMIENEAEIEALIKLAKDKSPQLYKAVMKEPNMIKCSLLLSKLTENKDLIRLASFYLTNEGKLNP